MNSIKRFLDRREKRFWWTVRSVLVALIALSIFVLGWKGGEEYVTNIYTELIDVVISIGFTVVFADRFYANREEVRQIQELKRQLVEQAGSGSNDVAIRAIEQLYEKGWLVGRDSLLKGENLSKANLRSANLQYANLRRADLQNAHLYKADLSYANPQGAKLTGANLRKAKLWFADFQGAFLVDVNLHGADYWKTTLPDGTPCTQPTDLDRFTNRDHPDFWTTVEKINEIRSALRFDN